MANKDTKEGTTVNVTEADHDHSKESYRTEEKSEPTTTVEVDGDSTTVTVDDDE